MNHIELSPGTAVGVALITAGILLYALRTREPKVSRGVIFQCTRDFFRHICEKSLVWDSKKKLE